MFVAYRDKFHLSEQDVRFVANGLRLKPFHTPEEARLPVTLSYTHKLQTFTTLPVAASA